MSWLASAAFFKCGKAATLATWAETIAPLYAICRNIKELRLIKNSSRVLFYDV